MRRRESAELAIGPPALHIAAMPAGWRSGPRTARVSARPLRAMCGGDRAVEAVMLGGQQHDIIWPAHPLGGRGLDRHAKIAERALFRASVPGQGGGRRQRCRTGGRSAARSGHPAEAPEDRRSRTADRPASASEPVRRADRRWSCRHCAASFGGYYQYVEWWGYALASRDGGV